MSRGLPRLASLLLLCSMTLSSCHWPGRTGTPTHAAAPGAEDNTSDPQWLLPRHRGADVAVVYVHGIFGDTLGTWTGSTTSFFKLLDADRTLTAPVDQFAFGYTSSMLGGGSFTIDEAARRLKERLEYNGVLEYPAVVFVAHSMGGLVVLRTLLTYRELMAHVPLIALYATPQSGAQIADIARYISPNPALTEMIPGDGDHYLEALDNDWKEAARTHPIPVVCAYEKRDTYHVTIVPRGSATRYCTEPSSAIDADHLTITKPDRPGHDSIVLLVNALNRYVTNQQWKPKLELPDFTREASGWVYTLNTYNQQAARIVNAGRLPLQYTVGDLSDPGLHVWPPENPHTIEGPGEGKLGFALAFGARLADYTLVLRSAGLPDEHVRVHVPNLPQQLAQQAAVTNSVLTDINNLLADPVQRDALAKAEPGDQKAADAITDRALQAVARAVPDAPRGVQWVITAEALNSVNWSTLAVDALRQAERSSAALVRLPSVSRTAAWVAESAGETHLFESAPIPIVPDQWKMPVGTGLAPGVDIAVAEQVTSRCQGIRALAGPCLSLKGDVAERRGDKAAAAAAFQDAAKVRMTPALSERLKRQVTPGAAVVPPAAVNDARIAAGSTIANRGNGSGGSQ